jgi:ubiquinone/menaquinone biosynthesis C-methylase UbiE
MNAQKIGLKQMERRYLTASNFEMAQLIINKTGVCRGKCLELAAGAGYLGFALAEITMLDIYLLENNRDAIKQAETHIARSNASDRINTVRGSVSEIPLPDDSMHLVTSKKTIFTWNNRLKIFKEVYRILAPGGFACFCGGFEPQDIRTRVNTCLTGVNPKLVSLLDTQVYTNQMHNFKKVLVEAEIPSFDVKCQDNGMWIVFGKPSFVAVMRGPQKFTYLGPPKAIHFDESAAL